jgi:peptidoglycan hydrolase CwlO-like protein
MWRKEVKKVSEDQAKYNNLDKVIEGNNSIFERLTTLENQMRAMISLYRDIVIDNSMLEKRIRALEQRNSYYPKVNIESKEAIEFLENGIDLSTRELETGYF